jgi:hypothetical protein
LTWIILILLFDKTVTLFTVMNQPGGGERLLQTQQMLQVPGRVLGFKPKREHDFG